MRIVSRLTARAAPVGLVCVVVLMLFGPSRARAAGLLIADGGNGGLLQVKEHSVHVTVNNGIAVTEVTQVFQNTENRQVEALYTFPVPKGASVANFSMWINGKEMTGEVVEKNRAREIYNSYKRVRRDPGLLEQTDFRSFEMRVFPIAALAEQKVQIAYYQELDVDHDWATYVYPLATATRPGLTNRTAGKFAINFDVKSQIPIVAMESPSNGKEFAIAKQGENYWQASLERKNGDLGRDVVLAYHIARPKTGIDVITSKQGSEDGYFCLTLTAGEELAAKEAGMDYVFVLDISGSMNDDGKLNLSRNSLRAFIDALGEKDRFEVMTFNVEPHVLFRRLATAAPDSKKTAADFLASQEARGGTVLHPALTTAYKYDDAQRPLNVVILSDGLTEEDERPQLISLIGQRPKNCKVFCIGVGNDVDRGLLSKMATDAGGMCAFLSQEDNFDRQAAAFRRKLMHPVASDLRISFAGLETYDLEPKTMPNLYYGMPIRVYGRYKNFGAAQVTLSGNIEGQPMTRTIPLVLPPADLANPEIERMWALHKVNRLLGEADASGSRTSVIDEIVRLGEGYSIVTEYTSFLVLENDGEFQRWHIDRKNSLRLQRDRNAQQALASELAGMRNKAAADLGPEPAMPTRSTASPVTSTPVSNTSPAASSPTPTASAPIPLHQQNSGDIDTGGKPGGGGGAIDPVSGLFVLALGGIAFASYRRARGARPRAAA
ncbi:MAG TPA: VIT and VWA domain-containing protein [Tepidisphaeraceae bacterium]|jgi:Ca-activated chloride channel family protein